MRNYAFGDGKEYLNPEKIVAFTFRKGCAYHESSYLYPSYRQLDFISYQSIFGKQKLKMNHLYLTHNMGL